MRLATTTCGLCGPSESSRSTAEQQPVLGCTPDGPTTSDPAGPPPPKFPSRTSVLVMLIEDEAAGTEAPSGSRVAVLPTRPGFGLCVEPERRVPVGDQHEGVGDDPVVPTDDALNKVEHAPRVPAGEQ